MIIICSTFTIEFTNMQYNLLESQNCQVMFEHQNILYN